MASVAAVRFRLRVVGGWHSAMLAGFVLNSASLAVRLYQYNISIILSRRHAGCCYHGGTNPELAAEPQVATVFVLSAIPVVAWCALP
jgi:hypothetical protein